MLVDDLLIDAPPDSMLALALHPNIDIRIYNPRLNVGTSKLKKIGNVATGLRTVNQRMHDKTALFDGQAGNHRRPQHPIRVRRRAAPRWTRRGTGWRP